MIMPGVLGEDVGIVVHFYSIVAGDCNVALKLSSFKVMAIIKSCRQGTKDERGPHLCISFNKGWLGVEHTPLSQGTVVSEMEWSLTKL